MLSGKHRIAFVHPPKTAGTSIAAAFGYKKLHRTAGAYEHLEGWTRIACVRHPLDRLVSTYHYVRTAKVHAGREILGPGGRLLPFSKWLVYHAENYTGPFGPLDVDGAEWTNNEPGSKFWFTPQVNWLLGTRGQHVEVRLFRFETLEEEWPAFAGPRGLPPLPHANATEHEPWHQYYDRAASEAALEIVKPDLDAFGYEMMPAG